VSSIRIPMLAAGLLALRGAWELPGNKHAVGAFNVGESSIASTVLILEKE